MLTPEFLLNRSLAAIAVVLMCTGGMHAQSMEAMELQENRPIGTWTDYLPYHQTEELVHCGTPLDTGFWAVRTEHAVFTLDERTNVVERISTVRGMSGSQPTALAWDPTGEVLIVGQASGSIDFFSNTGDWLYTLRDIEQSNLIGDKSILSLAIFDALDADLLVATTAFGVVAIHLRELDVRDTWYLEGQQALRRCHGITVHEENYVIWTDAGVFEAPVDHPFLSSPDAWSRWEDIPLETGDYAHVEFTPTGHILLHRKTGEASAPDELWLRRDGLWEPFEASESVQVLAIASGSISSDPSDWRIAIADHQSIRQFNADWEEIQLDYAADGVPLRVRGMVYRHAVDVMGNVGFVEFGDLFIANFEQGLLKMDVSGGRPMPIGALKVPR